MNRRRFLGSIAAITAAIGGTRVPDSVQASEMPADFAAAQAHGRALIEQAQRGTATWAEFQAVVAQARAAAWSDGYDAAEALSYRRGFNDGQDGAYQTLGDVFKQAAESLPEETRESVLTAPTITAAFQQIRADGYNRGREVEAARQESRMQEQGGWMIVPNHLTRGASFETPIGEPVSGFRPVLDPETGHLVAVQLPPEMEARWMTRAEKQASA